MHSSERLLFIEEHINTSGFSSLDELSLLCNTSTQTIRRDITKLDKEKKVVRVHGGASPLIKNDSFLNRRERSIQEKQIIGSLLRSVIPNAATLFIGGGTTLETCAHFLSSHESLFVMTTNLHVAIALQNSHLSTIIIPHGEAQKDTHSLLGTSVIECIEKYHMDFCVRSCVAIDDDGIFYENDNEVNANNQHLQKNAKKTILVADSSKFSRTARIKSCSIENIHIFISDKKPPLPLYEKLLNNNVQVIYDEKI